MSKTGTASTPTSIVILEDDSVAATELAEGLAQYGFRCIDVFASGEDLLARIDKLRPDILLVDITLAGKLDGIQTVMKLSKDLPSRIIFLTGNEDEETLRRAIVLRPHAYLLKPVDIADVRSTILTTLARDPLVESELLTSRHDAEIDPNVREPLKLLQSLPLFAHVSEDAITRLCARAMTREGSAGSYLIEQGHPAINTFVMLSGVAMCSRQASDGRQLTIYAAGPGDPFGFLLAQPEMSEQLTIRLPMDARYIAFPMDDVRHVINTVPEFAKIILSQTMIHLAQLSDFASRIAYSKVEVRIVQKLLELCRSIGRPVSTGGGVKIFLTRKELAEFAGTTVETAIRATKVLERQGLLDLTRPGIIVIPSLKKLESFADNEEG